jgi:fucose permease
MNVHTGRFEIAAVSGDPSLRLFDSRGVAAAFGAFILIGALQALYGPALPALRNDFGISPSSAGLALSAHFVGALLGVLLFARWYGRAGNRVLLTTSLVAMALGAAGFVLANSWPLALFCAFVGGLGFGGIDYGLNHLFAIGFGSRGAAMLNLLNAQFGVGAIVAPAVLAWVGPHRYPAVFVAVAVLTAVLLLGIGGVRDSGAVPPSPADTGQTTRRSLGVLLAFVVFYVLNVGIESGVGGWEPTHLEAVGYTLTAATAATAAYWLALTLGRFAVIPMTVRWPASAIVLWSSAGLAVCTGLSVIPAIAPFAYFGVGLFIAPIFPTGLAWLHELSPDAQRAGAYVVAASMIGGVVVPPLLGKGIEWTSAIAVPVMLLVLSVGCLILVARIRSTHAGSTVTAAMPVAHPDKTS